jgi:hypothetical protein
MHTVVAPIDASALKAIQNIHKGNLSFQIEVGQQI